MSDFSRFMKQNKVKQENGFFSPTSTLTDEAGEPLKWEFRHITSKENENLRDTCTLEVQVTGKPNLYRPRLNTSKYLSKMIATATVFPDLYDKKLQDSYGVVTPEDLVFAMVDDAGEYQSFCVWMQKFQGFDKSFQESVDEAKN